MRAFATLALATAACAVIPPYNLVERLALDPFESTLVTAVKAAGLVTALEGKGPFTVFAPSDLAFDMLPPGTLPKLLANTTLLSEVLLYHVVAGNVSSSQLKDGMVVPTLDKENVLINILPPHNGFPAAVLVNRDSRVTYANNYATNGVYHTIDRVLIPQHLQAQLLGAAVAFPPLNLVQRLQLVPEFSTLVTAVVAGGLAETLSGPGPFTVFAPDNFAFERLPPGALPKILANKTLLVEILTYHVVAGNVSSTQLTNGEQVKTVNGQDIVVTIADEPRPQPHKVIILNENTQFHRGSYVELPNNYATNGVFHAVSEVLVPHAL